MKSPNKLPYLPQDPTSKEDDDSDMDIDNDLPKYLILMGQDKRLIVTPLTSQMIRREVQKVKYQFYNCIIMIQRYDETNNAFHLGSASDKWQ